jgi:hypothetical protein
VTDFSSWQDIGACAGLADAGAIFYPERGASILPAQEICSGCDVWLECLVSSLRQTKIHYVSSEGVWGGMGGATRRAMLVAMRDVDHPPERSCKDPDCVWCDLIRAHRTNLDVVAGTRPRSARVRINSNGPGATHGRRASYVKGCRCLCCRFAISAIGKVLAADTDVVAWLEDLFPADDGGFAPTAAWTVLDEDGPRVSAMLVIAKATARRELQMDAVA